MTAPNTPTISHNYHRRSRYNILPTKLRYIFHCSIFNGSKRNSAFINPRIVANTQAFCKSIKQSICRWSCVAKDCSAIRRLQMDQPIPRANAKVPPTSPHPNQMMGVGTGLRHRQLILTGNRWEITIYDFYFDLSKKLTSDFNVKQKRLG